MKRGRETEAVQPSLEAVVATEAASSSEGEEDEDHGGSGGFLPSTGGDLFETTLSVDVHRGSSEVIQRFLRAVKAESDDGGSRGVCDDMSSAPSNAAVQPSSSGPQTVSDATDGATHHHLLLSFAREISSLVESQHRVLVPMFLAFVRDEVNHTSRFGCWKIYPV